MGDELSCFEDLEEPASAAELVLAREIPTEVDQKQGAYGQELWVAKMETEATLKKAWI